MAGKIGWGFPAFLNSDHNFVLMTQDKNHHQFNDSLCLFRCLVHHMGGDYCDQTHVLAAYERYRTAVNGQTGKVAENVYDCIRQLGFPISKLNMAAFRFTGVPESHLDLVENLFGIRFQIYRKNEPHKVFVCANPPPLITQS